MEKHIYGEGGIMPRLLVIFEDESLGRVGTLTEDIRKGACTGVCTVVNMGTGEVFSPGNDTWEHIPLIVGEIDA